VVWIVDDAVLPATTTEVTVPPLKPFCQPLFPVLGGADTSQLYVVYLVVVQYFIPLGVISCSATNRTSRLTPWNRLQMLGHLGSCPRFRDVVGAVRKFVRPNRDPLTCLRRCRTAF